MIGRRNHLIGFATSTAAAFAAQIKTRPHISYADVNPNAQDLAQSPRYAQRVDAKIDLNDSETALTDIDHESLMSRHEDADIFCQYNELIQHLANQPDLFNSFLPVNLLPNDREVAIATIFRKVKEVFADRNLLAEITASDAFLSVTPVCEGPHKSDSSWDDLVNDHKCMICSDLLAGPVILGCSHSFCGICLQEMRDSWESDDSEITYSCPTCREEIENEIFERILDNLIAQKVSFIHDCEPKRDWIKRREAYQIHMRNKVLNRELRKNGNEHFDDSPASDDAQYINATAMIIIALILAAAAAAFVKGRTNK